MRLGLFHSLFIPSWSQAWFREILVDYISCFHDVINPLKPKLVEKKKSSVRTEKKTLHHYKDQLVYAVKGTNPYLQRESYETHKF
jgi:hypothetical protein